MIFMPAAHCGIRTGYLAGKYPGRIGHLFSPGDERGPFDFMPYALDNGAFKAGPSWTPDPWEKMLAWSRLSGQVPMWVLVPDVVSDREATIRNWSKYSGRAAEFGKLAFAVQDGMTVADVPSDAEVVFVGGSTDWKWSTYRMWCSAFERVHIGRVNSYKRLWACHDAGAESADGTGFMRGNQLQYRGLLAYFSQSSGETERPIQQEIECTFS